LKVAVVIVPGRMTWLLQPLDLRVFAVLKSDIRKRCFEEIAGSNSGMLPPGKRIRIHGDAIRSVLVQRDWSAVMARSGLMGPGHTLREVLQEHVRDVDLTPRSPTVGELSEILNVTAVRAAALQTALKATVELASADDIRADAAAAAAAAPQGAAEPRASSSVNIVREPTLRLSRSARLPPAPHRADLAESFIVHREEQHRPLTRSMSAATLGGDGQSAAASAPLPATTAASRPTQRVRSFGSKR